MPDRPHRHANCGVKDCPVPFNHVHRHNVLHRGAETVEYSTTYALSCAGDCLERAAARRG